MAVSCKIKILQVKQLSYAREFDSPLHVPHWKVWKRFGDFFMAVIYSTELLYIPVKITAFKNYSSTFHIIAKHVDIYIVVGDTKCAISIIVLLLSR